MSLVDSTAETIGSFLSTAPQWTTPILERLRKGEDHLGIEGAAQKYQQYLVPGIITTTDHARYYSFYCWVLYRFINSKNSSRLLRDFKGSYYRRHEVAFMMGCFSHHDEPLGGLIGGGTNNHKARSFWEAGDPIPLDVDYFSDPLGGFGRYYRTVMRTMGLVADPEKPRWVYRLTKRGEALAQAFGESIRNTEYLRLLDQRGDLAYLPRDIAREYGNHACLCSTALACGADRNQLLDAFFRFDTPPDLANPHYRRRLTLGLLLDIVSKAGNHNLRSALRPALYLGEYAPGQEYRPAPAMIDWYARWRLVQARHTYTSALQSLWAAFLGYLCHNSASSGVPFGEFLDWAAGKLTIAHANMSVSQLLRALCSGTGLGDDWEDAHEEFADICRLQHGSDEYSLFQQVENCDSDGSVLINHALAILLQLFLRFLRLHLRGDPIWGEIADAPRLPMGLFIDDLLSMLKASKVTVFDTLEWLYQEYIIGQHEFIALEKLRYQKYDTLKFHYQDERFVWADNPADYREPIRYPALRLFNALTILTDLGLLSEEQGVYQLTSDGHTYLAEVLGMGHVN